MNLIRAEFRKTFIEALSYYPDYIVGLITDFFILFIVINTDGNKAYKVFGYILWMLASGVISEASMCISTEKQLGTLQNIMIKPYSIAQIVTVKTFVWFSINVIKAVRCAEYVQVGILIYHSLRMYRDNGALLCARLYNPDVYEGCIICEYNQLWLSFPVGKYS